MARLLLVLALGFLAAACGGGPTQDDADALQVVYSSSAEVQRAMQPLYFCLPADRECYQQAGPAIVAAVERARADVDPAIAETDDTCVEEAARLYRDSLDAYAEVGRSARAGDTTAADKALSQSTKLEIAYTRKFGECGSGEDRLAEYWSAVREADVELLRVGDELYACPNQACALDAAARGKAAADRGVTAVGNLIGRLDDNDAPACLPPVLRVLREAYSAAKRTFEALERKNVAAVERNARQAGELQVKAQEDMAACIGSADF